MKPLTYKDQLARIREILNDANNADFVALKEAARKVVVARSANESWDDLKNSIAELEGVLDTCK